MRASPRTPLASTTSMPPSRKPCMPYRLTPVVASARTVACVSAADTLTSNGVPCCDTSLPSWPTDLPAINAISRT
ncbi:hypothetical protein LMG3431_02347 [Achromobacter pestifer]|uniref:Uncharacterized protein n=1 Tax=Achromobacter pestifer TaxID=1353889 RepID=A0A6S6Z1E9_9BURK|nr:hypothetical protein LMG3431_02347 [Achromobacter pestifer]